MIVLKNILVATDFSDCAAVALNYGRDFARTFNARLHLVHVVEDVTLRYGPEAGFVTPDLQKGLEERAWSDVRALITDDDRALSIVPVVLTATNTAHAIVDYARANAIDLIITGTHGRGPIQLLLMGSVAERVVRTAPCPALTVHARERDFVASDAMVAKAKA
jgi:nucleotide-binding universal stress UspA family protein